MLRTRLIAGPVAGFVLSAVFATLMTVVSLAEVVIEPLRVVPGEPAPVALRLPAMHVVETDRYGRHPRLVTMQRLVAPGEVVPPGSTLAWTVTRVEDDRRPPSRWTVLGVWFLYFMVVRMLTAYLRVFSPHRGALLRTQLGLLGLSAGMMLVAKVVLVTTVLPPTVFPVAALPLLAAHFLDRRTALMVGVALSFLVASLVGYDSQAIAVFLGGSVSASVLFRDRKRPETMVLAGVGSGVVATAVLAAELLVLEGPGRLPSTARDFLVSGLSLTLVGGLASGVLAFLGQRFAVVALGAVSRNRLVELTDLDQPLLRKIATEAPGSWEHSRAMANLAEGAAAAIGADALLTRVGAYYHDLGKTCQPKFYIENLEPGETSPHIGLDPDLSADAIMAHVVEGVRILRDGGIPEPVVEFAYTHHGTGVIEYFWHRCVEQGNPKGLTEGFFRYPGMRPRTKETAILMIVDAVEAASRTVDPPTREAFEAMVQRILSVKLRQGQLDESGLTVEELRIITNNLTDTLGSVYHSRIKYPWQDRQARGQEQLPIPGPATEEEVAREMRAREVTGKQVVLPPSAPEP